MVLTQTTNLFPSSSNGAWRSKPVVGFEFAFRALEYN